MTDLSDQSKAELRELLAAANVPWSWEDAAETDRATVRDNDGAIITSVSAAWPTPNVIKAAVSCAPALLDEIDSLERDRQARRSLAAQLAEANRDLDADGCPHVVTSDEGTSYCGLAQTELDRLGKLAGLLRQERDELRRRLDAIKQLDVSPAASGEVFVDIRPLDPNPNGADTAFLHWSREAGWAHGPSGTSGTLGEMLHAMAVSALADRKRGEPNDG